MSLLIATGASKKGAYDFLLSCCINTGDECLIWPFGKQTGGRGSIFSRITGRTVLAHREICALVNGPSPADKPLALHSCGNGHLSCVNPNHLYWGSHQDNAQDAMAHGTLVYGESHPHRKISGDQAFSIYSDTRPSSVIAREFFISQTQVKAIRFGRKWVRYIAERLAKEVQS